MDTRIYLQGQQKDEISENFHRKYLCQEHSSSVIPENEQIVLFEEITLKGGGIYQYENPVEMVIFVIPVVGYLKIKLWTEELIQIGECAQLPMKNGQQLQICNQFKDEPIHFMQVGIRTSFSHNFKKIYFSGNSNNSLQVISGVRTRPDYFTTIYLGKYIGRHEGYLPLHPLIDNVFLYIIDGAMEVQNCLLEKSDGLSVSNSIKIDFEALSAEAIILLIRSSKLNFLG